MFPYIVYILRIPRVQKKLAALYWVQVALCCTYGDFELLRGEVVLEPVPELPLGLHLHLRLLVLEISPKTDFFENNSQLM